MDSMDSMDSMDFMDGSKWRRMFNANAPES
jgi:hypothetical protein